jgi:hypothetical protein
MSRLKVETGTPRLDVQGVTAKNVFSVLNVLLYLKEFLKDGLEWQ